jgi:hypothetical protein
MLSVDVALDKFHAFSIFSLLNAAFCALTFCLTFLCHQNHILKTPGKQPPHADISSFVV